MWMNEMDIDQAVERFKAHPVLGKYARFLSAFRDEVNAHSDGWAYWKAPAKAADRLMTLMNGHLFSGMGAYPRMQEPSEAEFKKTLTPIKAFYAKYGTKAGMKFPALDEAAQTPDFSVSNNGTLWGFTPLNKAASEWLDEHVQSEPWQWLGRTLNVEHRYARGLAEIISDNGFRVA